jgi:hypothetical protein
MTNTDHVDNSPDAYDGLTNMAIAALQAWIQHAVAPASARTNAWSSSFLKQEFESNIISWCWEYKDWQFL